MCGDHNIRFCFLTGDRRSQRWLCCLIAIATATTVLFFKGASFLESEFETSFIRLAMNLNESQQAQKYKVICMILTRPSNWETRGKAVKNTWAKRCHRAIYFYTGISNCTSEPICNESSAVGLNVPDGRDHLTAKTLGALNYSYVKYGSEADYFLKADDDTYVIAENLQQLLLQFKSVPLLYLGRRVDNILPKGYNSGGAGYIISKEAAMLLVENGTVHPVECRRNGRVEDVDIGRCLAKFGIYPQDEMDSTGRLTFHSDNPFRVLMGENIAKAYYVNISGAEFGDKTKSVRNKVFQLRDDKRCHFLTLTMSSHTSTAGNRRCKRWVCCLIAIAVTTVLFFKDKFKHPRSESFLKSEFVKTNVLDVYSTSYRRLTMNFNESQLTQKYRVICLILTRSSNWETRGKAVKNTWAKRCHKAIFFYTSIPDCTSHSICRESSAVGLDVPDGRDHLTAKTLGALNYSYVKYGSEADYFLKADDDTYVITENLQLILSQFQSISLLYLGNFFTGNLPKGYNSGGAGYIISNLAAKLLVKNRTLYPSECRADGGHEDVEIGRCLAKLGVYPQDYLDSTGKQFFHPENPLRILQEDTSGPGSYSYVNINGAEFGTKDAKRGHMLSNWTVTMHYVTTPEMYMYEFLLYHLRRIKFDDLTDA